MNLLSVNDKNMNRNQNKIINTSDKYKFGGTRRRKWPSAQGSFLFRSEESRRKKNTNWPKKYL